MWSPFPPSKQATHAIKELLLDLILSFIAYYALVHMLYLPVAHILQGPGWMTFQHTRSQVTFIRPHDDFVNRIVLSLWAARFLLRWRKHLACMWGNLAPVLHWLSPLSPEPYKACWCYPTPTSGEVARFVEGQDAEWVEERGIGIFL